MKNTKNNEKPSHAESSWNEALKFMTEIEDIEPGIEETIAAFNVNGLTTTGSCFGHNNCRYGKEKGWPAPWVCVQVYELTARLLGEKINQIRKDIADKFGVSFCETMDWRDPVYQETKKGVETYLKSAEFLKFERQDEKLKQKMSKLLDLFYKERPTPEHLKLSIIVSDQPHGFFCVSGRNGSFFIPVTPQSKQQLFERRAELTAFGQFLKERYLKSKAK